MLAQVAVQPTYRRAQRPLLVIDGHDHVEHRRASGTGQRLRVRARSPLQSSLPHKAHYLQAKMRLGCVMATGWL